MEAMLTLMTELQKLGYTEQTDYYKATLTSPDGDIVAVVDATAGVHNVTLTQGKEKSARSVEFKDIRTVEDAEEILSFIV